MCEASWKISCPPIPSWLSGYFGCGRAWPKCLAVAGAWLVVGGAAQEGVELRTAAGSRVHWRTGVSPGERAQLDRGGGRRRVATLDVVEFFLQFLLWKISSMDITRASTVINTVPH